MMSTNPTIRTTDSNVTTFSTQFYRFAPFGFRKFAAVGLRATALRLRNDRILLLNPIELDHSVRLKLDELGGVHFIAADLGHHLFIKDYLKVWPDAKVIGVKGLDQKRKDVKWDFIYQSPHQKPEDVFDLPGMETVLFEGFITYAVAWYHRPSGTLIESDLLMNLPCTEQYNPPSDQTGALSKYFAMGANPWSIWHKRLIWYLAVTDYALIRRDAKRVSEWEIQRIVPCHGDVLVGRANEAWNVLYEWFLHGPPRPTTVRWLADQFMKLQRKLFLM